MKVPRHPDLPCSSCGRLMWRSSSSLPAGQACCRPCRRERHTIAAGHTNCMLCGKELTEVQSRAGNRFCSGACGYRVTFLRTEPPTTHRRFRRLGSCRPLDADSETFFAGPPRRKKLSVYVYQDGTIDISCPGCIGRGEMQPDGLRSWCADCAVMTTLEKPFEQARQ